MTEDHGEAVTVERYRHLRTDGNGDAPAGVYRVVGVPGDAVTLLRVADADGRRRHTGELHRVDRDDVDDVFRSAANPDPRFDPGDVLDGLRWFPRAMLDRFR